MNTTLSPVTVQRFFALQGELVGMVEKDFSGLTPKLEQLIRIMEITQIELMVYQDRRYSDRRGVASPRQIAAPWRVPFWPRRCSTSSPPRH
jgi:hypothetical protein